MDSPNPDHTLKRKRSPVPPPPPPMDDARSGGVGVGQMPQPSVTQINYLMTAKGEKLKLVDGDADTFKDVLEIIDDYEGVLQRHESLAANLGAKLVAPLLLKSFEKLFDGPIRIVPASFGVESITWLDIVTFARTNPADFILTDRETHPGIRSCRFWMKGCQVEISEDDYRLIMSGAPERMIPTQAIPDDESAELATLNILENRLAILIKKADAVASKARQLKYHLKGRKEAVSNRKANEQLVVATEDNRLFSPQPFSAINAARSPVPETSKIQQKLLEQYLAPISHHPTQTQTPHASHSSRPKAARINTANTAEIPFLDYTDSHSHQSNHRRTSTPLPVSSSSDRPITGGSDQYRVLIAAKMATRIEKLGRGDPIWPPCDRCRRLKFECTKHLTACQACTRKHAKCSWKDVREGEVDGVIAVAGNGFVAGEGSGNASVNGSGGDGGGERMEFEREENGNNEQAILTQIASAATAASGR